MTQPYFDSLAMKLRVRFLIFIRYAKFALNFRNFKKFNEDSNILLACETDEDHLRSEESVWHLINPVGGRGPQNDEGVVPSQSPHGSLVFVIVNCEGI